MRLALTTAVQRFATSRNRPHATNSATITTGQQVPQLSALLSVSVGMGRQAVVLALALLHHPPASDGGANPLSRAALQRRARPHPDESAIYPTEPWPLPKSISPGTATVQLAPDITIASSSASGCAPLGGSAIFVSAAARYQPLLAGHPSPFDQAKRVQTVSVCVSSASEELGLGTNESYGLHVPIAGDITIDAATVYVRLPTPPHPPPPALSWLGLRRARCTRSRAWPRAPRSRPRA